MAATLEIFGSSIIVVGAFNPAIFTPDWLERNQLMGAEDAEKARQSSSLVITRQLSRFETDWFVLQVTDEQFSVASNGPLTPSIKDLAIGALSLLPHSPVRALGLNFYGHYKFGTVAEWHKLGDTLAPKDIWTELFPGEDRSVGTVDVSVVIEPCKRGETPATPDKKRLTMQPSSKIPSGVFLSYNDHHGFDAANAPRDKSIEWCTKLIEDNWQLIWDDAARVFQGVIDHAIAN